MHHGAVEQLVRGARARAIGNLVGEQISVGLAAALAGACLILLAGSQILHWFWPALLFLAGFAITAVGTWRSIPSPYTVAQWIDRRLGLADTISTAFHFGGTAQGGGPMATLQRERAESSATSVSPAAAVPFQFPRRGIWALAMLAVAGSLFLIRYARQGSLDLQRPMVEAVADFFQPDRPLLARNKNQPQRPGEQPIEVPMNSPDEAKKELDAAPDDVLNITDIPDVNAGVDIDAKAERKEVNAAPDPDGSMSEEGEDAAEGERSAAGKEGDEGKGQGGEKAANESKGAQKAGGENSNLLDKMRDAMANLLNKLNIQQPQSEATERASNDKGQGQKQSGGQKGQKGPGGEQPDGAKGEEGEASSDGDQMADAGKGKGGEKGIEPGSPNESKSGMGKQDGDKAFKDAEQLAAMGKLSEIFGKRAENIRGEMMIEVSSSKQQPLRTQYRGTDATHREAGGEIRRDEVPLVHQEYVQQYFDSVRKEPASKK